MQSASKLLDTGLNTVQSTLLLKKQVEVEKVQEDLDIKRRQFAERMAACKAKEEDLKKKQTQVRYWFGAQQIRTLYPTSEPWQDIYCKQFSTGLSNTSLLGY